MAAGSKRSSTTRSTGATKRGRPAGKVTSRTAPTAAPRGRKPSTPTKLAAKASQKPVRTRAPETTRKASPTRSPRRTDVVLAAQLDAIASGLEQLATLSASLEEMHVLLEALDRKMETLLAGNQAPGPSVTPPAPAVLEDDGQTGERSDDTPTSSWDTGAPASSWDSDASASSWNREEESSHWDKEEESSKAAD